MTRTTLASIGILGILVGAPAIASAQSPADRTFDPLSMDRYTPTSTLGVDVSYAVWDEPPNVTVDVLSLTLAGHVVNERGLGGYLAIPLSFLDVEIPFLLDDSEMALGNIELGGLFTKWVGRTALVFHAGVALPTASDDGAAAFQIYASTPRYGDLVHRVPNSSWLRLGFSPMGRSGNLFWRADIGLDVPLEEDGAVELGPVFRINVGGGIDVGSALLLAELVTTMTDPDASAVDDTASTLTLGARFGTGTLHPGVGLLLPLGFDDLEDFELAIVVSLAAHLEGR